MTVRLAEPLAAALDSQRGVVESAEDFAAVREPGAEPLIGESDNVLLATGTDNMTYGDGGAGKTTLKLDMGFHLAAGLDWLGFAVPKPRRVLLIEREGPRPFLRRKVDRKLEAWTGPPLERRLSILAAPWSSFTFAEEAWRARLAEMVNEREIDLLIAGPVNRLGMDAAGTLAEVNGFLGLIDEVRRQVNRPLAIDLVHHENKAGAVSGAWEGAGDTLMHVEARGNGSTVLRIQKARWSSADHGRTLDLAWTAGEGYEVRGERDLLSEIVELVADGTPRTVDEIRKATKAGTAAVREALEADADSFRILTSEEARMLSRSPRAKLYRAAL